MVTSVTAYLTILLHGPYVIYGLVAIKMIDGVGSGALWTSAFATIGDIVDEENRTTAMSMLQVTYSGGLALGFLLGGAANEIFKSYLASFYLVSILLVMSALVMAIFLPSRIGVGHSHPELEELTREQEIPSLEPHTGFKPAHLLRSFHEVPDMVVLACVTFLGMGMLTPIIKLYALDHLGLSESQFGMLVAPIAAAMGIFAVPLGRMGDKYGKCMAVCWGLFFSALAMWALALFRSIAIAGIAGIVIGLGFTIAFPAWNALVMSVTRPDRRGEVIGAVGLAQGLAAIVGASLGSFIYASDFLSFPRLGVINYNVPFWLSAILLSIGSVICFTWVRRLHCHRDPGGGVTIRQRNAVIALALIGLTSLALWISYRYARPVPPDRVAWAWIQQLVRGRPDKAMKYVVRRGAHWNGIEESKTVSTRLHRWHKTPETSYMVGSAESVTETHADVPVTFMVKHRSTVEHVVLCKQRSGEWKVCGLYSE